MLDGVVLDEGHEICDSDIMNRMTLQMHHSKYFGFNPAAMSF